MERGRVEKCASPHVRPQERDPFYQSYHRHEAFRDDLGYMPCVQGSILLPGRKTRQLPTFGSSFIEKWGHLEKCGGT